MKNQMKNTLLSAAFIAAGLTVANVQAANTANMTVQITITNTCDIETAPTVLDFGSQGVLTAAVDNTSTISVTCTTDAAYNIGINDGVAARTMTDGTNTISYELYSESTRTTVWGNTGAARLASTGTGLEQEFTVYGRVPAQATPAAGNYTDTVLVTATY